VVTVRDWAGGIPADLLPRIFEEMVTTKEPGRGTGIGLSIARGLVEQAFGGTLAVDVDDGIGSRFTLTLPTPIVTAAAVG
jgi:signal transduction histidine kinase